jgi:hypothetical protein
VEVYGQDNSRNHEERNAKKVGPKYQLEDMYDISQRRGQASEKIPKGH